MYQTEGIQKFKGLNQKLDDAFKKLIEKRLKDFTDTFLSDIDIEKLKKIKADYSTDVELNENDKTILDNLKIQMFDFLIELNIKRNSKELLIKETKEILDRVMNSASHHTDNPLYSNELKEAIEKVKSLKDILHED